MTIVNLVSIINIINVINIIINIIIIVIIIVMQTSLSSTPQARPLHGYNTHLAQRSTENKEAHASTRSSVVKSKPPAIIIIILTTIHHRHAAQLIQHPQARPLHGSMPTPTPHI
jgi:hypothetical protein